MQTDLMTAEAAARVLRLSSRSPRRRQLLDEHGIDHDAEHPGFDDSDLKPGLVSAGQWVAALAYLKAAAGAALVREQRASVSAVLGADTAIVKDGKLIGTPRDAEDARAILRSLANGEHEVVTGVSLVCAATDKRVLFVDRAVVRLGPLTEVVIEEYVLSGAWAGKAGGYNLRERIEAGWPIQFEGDPGTIMGLPMRGLRDRLDRFTGNTQTRKVPA